MKKYRILCVLVVLFLSLLLIWQGIQKTQESNDPTDLEPREDKGGPSQGRDVKDGDGTKGPDFVDISEVEKRMGRPFTQEEKNLKPADKGWHEWAVFLDQHRMDAFMDGRVEFYGKVVTPEGEPIPGVSLIAEVDYYLNSIPEKLLKGSVRGKKEIEITTDEEGKFSVRSTEGSKLTLYKFSKEGFELPGRKRGWAYPFNPNIRDYYKADPGSPEIFTMRRIE